MKVSFKDQLKKREKMAEWKVYTVVYSKSVCEHKNKLHQIKKKCGGKLLSTGLTHS